MCLSEAYCSLQGFIRDSARVRVRVRVRNISREQGAVRVGLLETVCHWRYVEFILTPCVSNYP